MPPIERATVDGGRGESLSLRTLLGLAGDVPLTCRAMAAGLCVSVYPRTLVTEGLTHFLDELKVALQKVGCTVISFEEAIARGEGRIGAGIAIISPGEGVVGDLAIDHVGDLARNVVVGLYEGPCPADAETVRQGKLDRVVQVYARHLVHVAIFIDRDTWTVCTMNGAIVRCLRNKPIETDVLETLVPKIAAPTVPPRRSDFLVREGGLDPLDTHLRPAVHDLVNSGRLWEESGAMTSHTPLSSLTFPSRKYQKIVSAYLDSRSGMSYGFLVRQLPTPVTPALYLDELESDITNENWGHGMVHRVGGRFYVSVRVCDRTYAVPVPAVKVLSTRSGCDKTRLNPITDVVALSLEAGRITFETPASLAALADCRPSYDTLVILAHAVGNAIVASVLARLRPESSWLRWLSEDGLAVAHWHGFLPSGAIPPDHLTYGETNPAVSCSTPQSAIYALAAKIDTLELRLRARGEFIAEVHVEPHHGTNIIGRSLTNAAEWLARVTA